MPILEAQSTARSDRDLVTSFWSFAIPSCLITESASIGEAQIASWASPAKKMKSKRTMSRDKKKIVQQEER